MRRVASFVEFLGQHSCRRLWRLARTDSLDAMLRTKALSLTPDAAQEQSNRAATVLACDQRRWSK